MKVGELLEQLQGAKTDAQIRVVERIKSELHYFDKNTPLKDLDSIETFFRNGGFWNSRAVTRTEEEIQKELEDILAQVRLWVTERSHEATDVVIEAIDRRRRIVMYFFLGLLGVIALAAFVFLILRFTCKKEWIQTYGDDIAEGFGILDFLIGTIGFIWERVADMHKGRTVRKLDNAIESGNTEKFADTLQQQPCIKKLIIKNINKNVQRAGDHSVQINGNGNTVGNNNQNIVVNTWGPADAVITDINDILKIFHFQDKH